MNDAEAKIEKVTELVRMIQAKLIQMIKNAPADVAEAYKGFLEESRSVGTVEDLDYLYVKLKGVSAEDLIKEFEEEEKSDTMPHHSELEVPPLVAKHHNAENVFLSADDNSVSSSQVLPSEAVVSPVTVVDEEAIKKAVSEAKKEAQVKLKKEHFKLVRL